MSDEFTSEEWDACLKVLRILSRNPFDAPDELVFKGLIKKIHTKARKFHSCQKQARQTTV